MKWKASWIKSTTFANLSKLMKSRKEKLGNSNWQERISPKCYLIYELSHFSKVLSKLSDIEHHDCVSISIDLELVE